ncbi:MAG TPA: EAL domain-containing protein [Trebonia sp.]|nr:EAL domain-containing protein [Trebonia sp.]
MGKLVTARGALAGYALWMALLVAAHYAAAGLWPQTTLLIQLSGVAAMAAGVARNRPAHAAPWLLLAAANLATGAVAVGAGVLAPGTHVRTFPSFADAFSLLAYPLTAGGLGLFIRYRSRERDRRSVIDALMLTVGIAVLSWLFLIAPAATSPSFSWPERIVAVLYPVGDLVVLLTLARLFTPGTARGPASVLVAAGAVSAIGSSAAYDLIEVSPHPRGQLLVGLGLLGCYVAWGAAALHPSMTELTRSSRGRIREAAPGSVVLLMLASLIPPAYLLVHAVEQPDGAEFVVAVGCGVLYLLMLTRVWDAAGANRRSLFRERTLRMAGAALASAGSLEEIAAAVREAASALVPSERAAILAIRDGDYLRQVDPDGNPAYSPPDPVGIWLKLAAGRKPRFVSIPEITVARHGIASSAPAPGEPVRRGYEGVLLCPLTLQDRPAGDPFIGLLEFFGDRRAMDGLSAALEILAGQAAMAVERVELTQEVIRQRGEALFRALVQDASDVILIVGDDRRVRYATPSARDIFGAVTITGALLTDLVAARSREDIDRVLDLVLSTLSSGPAPVRRGAPRGYVIQVERLDGRTVTLEVRWSDLRTEPAVGGLVLTLRDVTEHHQLELDLKYQAFHDTLTGLPNRARFVREVAAAIADARAAGRTAGVLFVDLDDFKVVNDTMGHGVGDELLVAAASRLTAAVRRCDTAARLGGDEFALLIDDAADPAAVDAFAERVVAAFAEPFTLSQAKVVSSVTVGVATSADSGDVDEALRHADLALYAAKTAGKRRWRHYQPALSSGMLKRREIQAALEDAVKSSSFTLAYQPIVSLSSGEIAGFEALVRWPDSRWGTMLPGQFITLAEETGLIVPLGAWVLRQALGDMVRWRRALRDPRDPRDSLSGVLPQPGVPASGVPGPGTPLSGAPVPEVSVPHVSVNVSARQFLDPGFADSVRQALEASQLPPSALLLELTESLLHGGSDRVRADLAELKEIGVRLAIDDFGTGYSSLGQLLDLPIDVLKVDKMFVTGIASSWRRHALVEGIVRLARTLEVEVIAEGIESEAEREVLAGMGCQYGQGYLLSVPVDAEAAAAMLRHGRRLVTELPRQRGTSPDTGSRVRESPAD